MFSMPDNELGVEGGQFLVPVLGRLTQLTYLDLGSEYYVRVLFFVSFFVFRWVCARPNNRLCVGFGHTRTHTVTKRCGCGTTVRA